MHSNGMQPTMRGAKTTLCDLRAYLCVKVIQMHRKIQQEIDEKKIHRKTSGSDCDCDGCNKFIPST